MATNNQDSNNSRSQRRRSSKRSSQASSDFQMYSRYGSDSESESEPLQFTSDRGTRSTENANYRSRTSYSTISPGSGYSQGSSSYDRQVQKKSSRAHYNDPTYYRGASTRRKRGLPLGTFLGGLLVLAVVAFGVWFYIHSLPVKITLNETIVNVSGKKTLADAISEQGLNPQPGNLVDVEGVVITEGGGELLFASINDEKTTDTTVRLHNGDVVVVSNGDNVMEDYSVTTEAIPASTEITTEGWGTIHLFEGDGSDGEKEIRTGAISGKTVEVVTKEPGDFIRRNVYANTGEDKVVALTFDDGPWPDSTAEILDVLAEYDAKATFFTIGEQITETDYGAALIKREYEEGHQICTHTYDHASGSGQGVSLDLMSHEEQIEEITKGYAAIESITGTTASTVIRAPGGNFNDDTALNLHTYISAEIYWDIDTEDWSRPGTSSIVSSIEANVWSGCIVLMHDGGGDRSQTVEALKEVLPYLVSQGYSFVTIDELLTYDLS